MSLPLPLHLGTQAQFDSAIGPYACLLDIFRTAVGENVFYFCNQDVPLGTTKCIVHCPVWGEKRQMISIPELTFLVGSSTHTFLYSVSVTGVRLYMKPWRGVPIPFPGKGLKGLVPDGIVTWYLPMLCPQLTTSITTPPSFLRKQCLTSRYCVLIFSPPLTVILSC